MDKIEKMRLMRVYEIKGRFGVWTEDFTPKSSVIETIFYVSQTLILLITDMLLMRPPKIVSSYPNIIS